MPKTTFNIKNFIIRNANVEDINTLLIIEEESYGEHHWSKKTFESELTNSYSNYFVVVENCSNKVIAYIGYWKVQQEGHITTLAVDKLYRRNGVADILLYFLINHSIENNINSLTLEVRVTNIQALLLYKKYGFKEFGIRKKYYQNNNEDALILWLDNLNEYMSLNRNNAYADILKYISGF